MLRIVASSLIAVLLGSSIVPPAHAAGRTIGQYAYADSVQVAQFPGGVQVTRAQFLEQAVIMLYGADAEEFSVPFRAVPASARTAVGLARRIGALPRTWGSEENWNAPVSRCESLGILFDLAQVKPKIFSSKNFRDVRGSQKSIVQQALAWNVLQPLSADMFGCGRVLSGSDFPVMLESIASHIERPLAIPNAVSAPGTRTPQRPARTRTPAARQQKEPRKVQITIGRASTDTGQRTVRRTSSKLPRHDMLEAAWGLISSRFLYRDTIDEQKIAEEVAKAIVKQLGDPYSSFMPPVQASNFKTHLQGEISGIGAQVESNALGGLTVITPITGSPAIRAGVRPGDRIIAVDGVSIEEDDLQTAVARIRGPKGTKVELTIERNGSKLLIPVVRDTIVIPEIEITMQDGVLIVKLIQFGETTRRELTTHLQKALSAEPIGIVLDLRNNPGGLLDAAVDVASHFLPEGTLVLQVRSTESLRKEYTRAEKQIVPADMPLVVLVNKGSASASEIVAGALQDHKRAKVVGSTTFGKGTVQEVVQFTTGESLKITIAEWLTPLGTSIDKTGVKPDIELDEQQKGDRDEQLLEAIRLVKAKAR